MYTETAYNEAQGDTMVRNILIGVCSDHFERLWEARNKALVDDTDNEEICNIRSTEIAEVKYYFSRPDLLRFDNHHNYREGSLSTLLNRRELDNLSYFFFTTK